MAVARATAAAVAVTAAVIERGRFGGSRRVAEPLRDGLKKSDVLAVSAVFGPCGAILNFWNAF